MLARGKQVLTKELEQVLKLEREKLTEVAYELMVDILRLLLFHSHELVID